MGAQLVSTVLVRWANLDDRAFRVLVRMALTALDQPTDGKPACLYFGGLDLLAMTLRRDFGGSLDGAKRTAQRATADLVAAGAIERVGIARTGVNQTYRLTLDRQQNFKPARKRSQPSREHDSQVSSTPPEAITSEHDTYCRAEDDSRCHPKDDTQLSPEHDSWVTSQGTNEEPIEELSQEKLVDPHPVVTVPRARTSPEHPIDVDGRETDKPPDPTKCGHGLKINMRPDGSTSCALCRLGYAAA